MSERPTSSVQSRIVLPYEVYCKLRELMKKYGLTKESELIKIAIKHLYDDCEFSLNQIKNKK